MSSFKLTGSDGKEYELDTQGGVSLKGQSVGAWTANSKNHLTLTKHSGATTTFSVKWLFDANNQLGLHDAKGEVFNFGADSPAYALIGNALEVQPGDSVAFKFSLLPRWSLDPDNNLVADINGAKSTLVGYVDDSSSRFIFWFEDKAQPLPEYMLVFSGRWQRASGDKTVNLVFKGKVQGTSFNFSFTLRKGETFVDPAHNHLVIEYQSSQGLKRIELRGSLSIIEKPNKKLGLTFAIAQQTGLQGGVLVESREIRVNSTFEFNKLNGQLEVLVGNVKTAKSQKLTIGGAFQARLGSAGLEISFLYQREILAGLSPITASVSLALNCAFTFKNGKIIFNYSRAGKIDSFKLKGELIFGKVGVDVGVAIVNDPQDRVVKGFLGITW